MRVLILGWSGYVGNRVATTLLERGHEVVGVHRSPGSRPAAPGPVPAQKLQIIQADISIPEQLERVPLPFDWVVNCIAAAEPTPEGYRKAYLEGNRNLVAWLVGTPPRQFVYTSSTGVYHHDNGEVVDESSDTQPQSETGRILVEAEKLLLEAHRKTGFPAIILRLAGIYGPGRGYWLKQFASGEARMEGNGSRLLNMVHVEDVVGAAVAALQKGTPGEVYNVCDNAPSSQLQVFTWLSQTLRSPMPGPADQARVTGRRVATNKRISNRKLREQLGYHLQFPTFREGFARELAAYTEVPSARAQPTR